MSKLVSLPAVSELGVERKGGFFNRLKQTGFRLKESLLKEWTMVIFAVGFLLGRALILGELAPFIVPFIAVVYHIQRNRLTVASLSILLGAHSHPLASPAKAVIAILFFILIQKVLERWRKGALAYSPLSV